MVNNHIGISINAQAKSMSKTVLTKTDQVNGHISLMPLNALPLARNFNCFYCPLVMDLCPLHGLQQKFTIYSWRCPFPRRKCLGVVALFLYPKTPHVYPNLSLTLTLLTDTPTKSNTMVIQHTNWLTSKRFEFDGMPDQKYLVLTQLLQSKEN